MFMAKLKVAVITGGDNAEREISLKSAETIIKHLDPDKYSSWKIDFTNAQFIDMASETVLDMNDFSLFSKKEKIKFDLVFFILHGIHAESGQLQGYFDLLKIPYCGCDHFTSALSFDKQACKDYLRNFDVPMAKSVMITKQTDLDQGVLKALKDLTLFVKPNKNGSSWGVSKVDADADYTKAIAKAFEYDDEVIVEEYLKGREFSNGVYLSSKGMQVLPVTEIIPFGDFFDYKAKYKNESSEITPAELDPALSKKAQLQSLKLFQVLNCTGFVRFDYILRGDTFFFLEVNTIPGMSEQSLVPQQLAADNKSVGLMLDEIIEETLSRYSY